MLMYGFDLFIF